MGKISYDGDSSYFTRILQRVKELCPNQTPGEIKHIANLLSNKIRSLKYDIYGVDLQTNFNDLSHVQYSNDEIVRWRHMTFYLRVTID